MKNFWNRSRNTKSYLVRSLFAGLLFLAVSPITVSAIKAADSPFNCDRSCLKSMGDLYFEAMAANDHTLLPLAAKVKYTETGKIVPLGTGMWQSVDGLPVQRLDIIDPETGGLGIHAVVPDRGLLTMIALRLKVMNHQITEIETILVSEDTMIVGATPRERQDTSKYWTRTIPPAEQNSRFELIAAADSYFRAFETNGSPAYIQASLMPDTVRYENGMQTTLVARGDNPPRTTSSGFDSGNYKGALVTDVRYPVVDTETGVVMSLVRFGEAMGPLGAPGLPPGTDPALIPDVLVGSAFVSEIFAITQGKIVGIEAFFIPSDGHVPTPWPAGSVPMADH